MTIVRRPFHRLLLAFAGLLGLTLVAAARNLEPDPRGFGTHEQLGLTPCYFQISTGYVCPMCGCTTAWAHLVRGELPQAASAHLGGMLLCVAVVIVSLWVLMVAICGHWPVARPALRPMLMVASVWLVVVGCDWLHRITLGW